MFSLDFEVKFYLAARYSRRREMCDVSADLEAIGWTPKCRWINGGHGPGEGSDQAAHGDRQRFAMEDVSDLMSSDVCINFTEEPRVEGPGGSRGGRHVEFGMAYSLGLRQLIIGPYENVFHTLPSVERFEDWASALSTIKARHAKFLAQ